MRNARYKISYSGGYFHIYNRGNQKQNIFLEEADYIHYLNKLRKYKEQSKISIICYCLMPNHIHLLVRQDSEISTSKFMSPFHTSYSVYFNKKYEKVGHLFQDRFKQKHVDKDEYLLQLAGYIHLNPLIHGLVEKIDNYQWSSYSDYIGLREGTLCDKEPVLLGQLPDEYKRTTEQEIKELLLKKEFQDHFNDCP